MIYIIYCVSSNKCRMSNKCSRLISTTPLSIHIEMIASLSLSLSPDICKFTIKGHIERSHF